MKNKFVKKRRYINPFLPKRSKLDISRDKRKKRIFLISIIVLTINGLIYLFIYAPIFRIDKIVISGAKTSYILNKVQRIVQAEIDGYRYYILPKNNIFLINKLDLIDSIKAGLVLDDLVVEKKLLNRLDIKVVEKIPVLLWKEGQQFYYIDKEGVVMKAIDRDKIKYDLPIINKGTTTQVIVNEKIIDISDVEFIESVLGEFKKIFKSLQITRIEVRDPGSHEIYFYTDEGWYFLINSDGKVINKLNNLSKLLEQKIDDREKLEYVDLRIGDRIFYK